MEKLKFNLDGNEYIELIKLLKTMGLCDSGGQAKTVVEDGLVKVNKELESRKRRKCRPGDVVEFAEAQITIT